MSFLMDFSKTIRLHALYLTSLTRKKMGEFMKEAGDEIGKSAHVFEYDRSNILRRLKLLYLDH